MKKATWEWFTGYFDRTMHFCPSCKTRNPHLVRRLLNESRITPEDGARKKSATGAIDAAMSDAPAAGER
ncbi:hypothetical protein [Cupriavidus oxalaticus]|uniref:hypothetical protein n=1 Tax=Cupriavidus oxalaticus TaxID=96344 RepID=UPI0012447276|nr:hypothetical protein [Cupriavidus oxalaticus]